MADQRRPARAARAAQPAQASPPGGTNDAATTIFQGEGSNIIPGELVITLKPGTPITASIPTAPAGPALTGGPSTFGHSALDNALAQLNVVSITRLAPPDPPSEARAFAATEEPARPLSNAYRLRFDPGTAVPDAVARLSDLSEVEVAEPNYYRETYLTPSDPSFPQQWGLTKINAPAAWDRFVGSPSVVIAVIDTGVDLDHPELAPLLLPGRDLVDLGPSPTPPIGFRFEGDFSGRDDTPQDEVGHGTHVAGTIAALSNNGVGVAGVTWACRLMPVKVLTRIVNISNPADVRGTGSSADVAAGIRWAADHGAHILSMSLGSSSPTTVERQAVEYAISRGCTVIAAMGNGGPSAGPSYPAAYVGVISVGATDSGDRRASFSQVGSHIDVVAPGVNILSTVWNNGYTRMSGTSMATPHVSGVAALIKSAKPAATAAEIGDILRGTARPLRDNPPDPVPNNNYGYGLIDARAAVDRASPPIGRTLPPVCVSPRTIVGCPPRTALCPRPTLVCPTVVCPRQTIFCPRPTLACPRPTVFCPRPTLVCGGFPPIFRIGPTGEEYGYDPYGAWTEPYGGYDAYGQDAGYGHWSGYDPYAGYGTWDLGYDPYAEYGTWEAGVDPYAGNATYEEPGYDPYATQFVVGYDPYGGWGAYGADWQTYGGAEGGDVYAQATVPPQCPPTLPPACPPTLPPQCPPTLPPWCPPPTAACPPPTVPPRCPPPTPFCPPVTLPPRCPPRTRPPQCPPPTPFCPRTPFCPPPTPACPPPTPFCPRTPFCPPPTPACPPPTPFCPRTPFCPPPTPACPPPTPFCPRTPFCPPPTPFCPRTPACPRPTPFCPRPTLPGGCPPQTLACPGPDPLSETGWETWDSYGYGTEGGAATTEPSGL